MDDRFLSEIVKINQAMLIIAKAKAIRKHIINPTKKSR